MAARLQEPLKLKIGTWLDRTLVILVCRDAKTLVGVSPEAGWKCKLKWTRESYFIVAFHVFNAFRFVANSGRNQDQFTRFA